MKCVILQNCGLVLITNAKKAEPEPVQNHPDPRLFRGGVGGGVFGGPPARMAKMAMPQAVGFAAVDNMVMDDAFVQPEMCFASSMPMPQVTIRKEFPETWLWEDFPDNE